MENNLEMLLAMQDDEFQKILANDAMLNALEAEKNDRQVQYFELVSILTKRFTICGISVSPITPIMWCFLYCIGNKFVEDPREARYIDIDVMMYLLHNGVNAINDDLINTANGFCKQHNINYENAGREILDLIGLAFRPLQMFPKKTLNLEDVRYNVDWMTKIVSMVCEITGKDSDYVMREMSLTQALSYVVQHARRNDIKGEIRRRNSDEVNIEIYKRTMELGQEYYNTKYVQGK